MSGDTAMTYAVAIVALAGAGASTRLDRITRPACNLVISNVPGAKQACYLNGAPLVGIFPVSALAAAISLNVTLSSTATTWTSGYRHQRGGIDDVHALADHTRQAYADLKEAAKIAARTSSRPVEGWHREQPRRHLRQRIDPGPVQRRVAPPAPIRSCGAPSITRPCSSTSTGRRSP